LTPNRLGSRPDQTEPSEFRAHIQSAEHPADLGKTGRTLHVSTQVLPTTPDGAARKQIRDKPESRRWKQADERILRSAFKRIPAQRILLVSAPAASSPGRPRGMEASLSASLPPLRLGILTYRRFRRQLSFFRTAGLMMWSGIPPANTSRMRFTALACSSWSDPSE
jgi:hypothetical protein